MLNLVLLVVITIYLVINIKIKQNFWQTKGISYVKPKFLLGILSLFPSKSVFEVVQDLYNLFPNERYTGMYLFLEPVLLVKDPELLKQITVKEFDHFVNHRKFVSPEVDSFWTKNLFANEGQRWRAMRATLSPSFTSSKMKLMFGIMEKCAKQYIDYYLEQNNNKLMIEIEMKDSLSRFSNDVIASAGFGIECNSLKDKTNDFYLMGKDGINLNPERFMRFFICTISPIISEVFRIKVIPPRIANYFTSVINNIVEIRKTENIIRPDMIHLLMEAQKEAQSSLNKGEITIEDIAGQAFFFLFAGFDTVSTHLSFTLYELAINPEIQNRLRSELCSISEPINYETLLKMEYLDMVHSESLRKWPPSTNGDRKVTKAFTIEPVLPHEKPLRLKEGTVCWIPIVGLHRDPQHFSDPDHFDPERFSKKNKHKIKSGTYMPFGFGPRNCIGSRFGLLESKLLIYHILKNFEIVPVQKTKIPMVLDPKNANPGVKGGMWLGFQKITN